jgi:hypothetical protein
VEVLLLLEVVAPARRVGARRLARGGAIAAAPLLTVLALTLALVVWSRAPLG